MSRLTKPANQHVVTSIKEDDARRHADQYGTTSYRLNRVARIAITCVKDKADARESLWILPDLLNECGEELVWEVIDRTEANIFE